MHEQIRAYVNKLFEHTPSTRMVDEAREELLSGCIDKYEDLIKGGTGEEDAYRTVITGIGDVGELVSSLGKTNEFDVQKIEANRNKRAIFISVAVALYIIALASVIIIDTYSPLPDLAPISLFVISAIATGILIYGNMSTSTSYKKQEDTIVENVKEKISGSDKNSQLRKAISSTMWTLLVVVYLVVSFSTGWWHITWILFLVGALIENIIQLASSGSTGHIHGILWLLIVILYFVISFWSHGWVWTWLLFPLGAAAQQIIRLIRIWRQV